MPFEWLLVIWLEYFSNLWTEALIWFYRFVQSWIVHLTDYHHCASTHAAQINCTMKRLSVIVKLCTRVISQIKIILLSCRNSCFVDLALPTALCSSIAQDGNVFSRQHSRHFNDVLSSKTEMASMFADLYTWWRPFWLL